MASLITNIPADCKDLTVHDVSHLDALWEMASLIAGQDFQITPAEAFVLGGAILLHDAGLSAASYRGGLNEIKQTEEWRDIAASVLRRNGIEPTSATISAPPVYIADEIKFSVLRVLHARQAETMATMAWSTSREDSIYLLDDTELRDAFGLSIGKIARSHHWPIERVAEFLVDDVGAGTVLPSEWAVSERKLACVLRCSDAAHIDRRRAPTFLFASTRPTGVSATHWGAQNKINKPAVQRGTLFYTAGQPFGRKEADSWWLAYDLIKLADREIRASNALLEEIGLPTFQVVRVFGAESPRALSTRLRADGWRPVDAEIRVSDPIHLAQTLGGRNLYGSQSIAPIRELLQNSVDAIRARRALEGRDEAWGKIKVTLEPDASNGKGCWLHVDDNGIGMTERILSGPLIDFGKSTWFSSLLQEEFPGLHAKDIKPIGKFGIGFFSVFDLSKELKVISKHFQSGVSDAKVLEFTSLITRPVIRAAEPDELPRDFSTRISLRILDSNTLMRRREELDYFPPRGRRIIPSFENSLLRLIAMVDVDIDYVNKPKGTSFTHSADIYNVSVSTFIDELLPDIPEERRDELKMAHGDLMMPVQDASGNGMDEPRFLQRGTMYMRSEPHFDN